MTVGEAATVLRSKNAGIGLITVDVVCESLAGYECVKATLTRDCVARAYRVPVDSVVDIVHFDEGLALKVSFLRPRLAGSLGETDLYGSAQYAPIQDVEVGQLTLDRRPADVVT